MKSKINLRTFKYLLFLPLLLFTFCESNEEISLSEAEARLTKDSDVVNLMKKAIGGSNQTPVKGSDGDDQCTSFKYPMTLDVYYGDYPEAERVEINSDEELLTLFEKLTSTSGFYLNFPITLIDVEGVETVINNLAELEGTLEMAVEACIGGDDDQYCDDKLKKVAICHNGHTICVSVNAIWGHLNQHEDDYLGSCD